MLPCVTPHRANTGSFRGTIFHVNDLCPQLMGPHRLQADSGWGWTLQGYYPKVMSRSWQGHLKVKPAKILKKQHFLHFFVARLQLTLLWLRRLSTCILGTVNIMRLGWVIPHSYPPPPRPLLYHTLYNTKISVKNGQLKSCGTWA